MAQTTRPALFGPYLARDVSRLEPPAIIPPLPVLSFPCPVPRCPFAVFLFHGGCEKEGS
jgi:hypothetical protein